jgi:alkylation response protein AidB-like acyl-CoA dehydrogenase
MSARRTGRAKPRQPPCRGASGAVRSAHTAKSKAPPAASAAVSARDLRVHQILAGTDGIMRMIVARGLIEN